MTKLLDLAEEDHDITTGVAKHFVEQTNKMLGEVLPRISQRMDDLERENGKLESVGNESGVGIEIVTMDKTAVFAQ